MSTQRTSGVIRSLRRSWTPYRVYQDTYRDRQNAVLSTTVLDTGFGVDLISVSPNCQGGPCVPPVKTPVEVLDRYYYRTGDEVSVVSGFPMDGIDPDTDYEYHLMYRATTNPDRVTPTGEVDWEGSSIYITGVAARSDLYQADVPFNETMTLTVSTTRRFAIEFEEDPVFDNIQTIVAQSNRLGLGTLDQPVVDIFRKDYVVLAATGTWTGATNVINTVSDRPFAPSDERVVYIWRGYGGERPANPLVESVA
jgi:hypothetical protein